MQVFTVTWAVHKEQPHAEASQQASRPVERTVDVTDSTLKVSAAYYQHDNQRYRCLPGAVRGVVTEDGSAVMPLQCHFDWGSKEAS